MLSSEPALDLSSTLVTADQVPEGLSTGILRQFLVGVRQCTVSSTSTGAFGPHSPHGGSAHDSGCLRKQAHWETPVAGCRTERIWKQLKWSRHSRAQLYWCQIGMLIL